MMEIEASLLVLLRQGSYYDSLDNSPTAHLTPMHFIEHTPCMYFTMYRTAMGWPGNKGIYKYVQICAYRIKKRRVISITQNGDLTKDVSTRSSTYIKTLANKEKFPY